MEGRLQSRSWEDKEGQKRYITEVVADELILLGGGGRGGDAPGGGGEYDAPRERGPVSMPRSAQQRSRLPRLLRPTTSARESPTTTFRSRAAALFEPRPLQ